jgi:hypothetical protein
MKKISVALAMALVCAVPALAAKPPKPVKPNTNLTLTASSTAVNFGRSVTFTGTVKNVASGTVVELQQNPYPYAGFKASGKSAVVDPAGSYSIAGVVPQAHTQYKAVAKTSPPTTSGTVFVRVRMSVRLSLSDSTPKRGQAVRFFGTAAPAHDGKPVLIQKRTTTGYKTVARTVLLDNGTATSKYSKKLTMRSSGTYRVVAQSLDQAIDNGTSRSRAVRVH